MADRTCTCSRDDVSTSDDASTRQDASPFRRQGATTGWMAVTAGDDDAGRLRRQLDREAGGLTTGHAGRLIVHQDLASMPRMGAVPLWANVDLSHRRARGESSEFEAGSGLF